MKKTRLISSLLLIIMSLLLIFTACGSVAEETTPVDTASCQPPATKEPEESPAETASEQAAQCTPATTDGSASMPQTTANGFYPWMVYWDNETAISESSALSSVMGSISVFAAYFKQDDGIVFPQTSEDTLQAVRGAYGTSVKTYLTFVNDIKYDNGESSLKDVDLLKRLFSSSTRMNAHIDEIISLAKQKGVDGIEIDYEDIKGDDALWQLFSEFLTALKDKTSSEGLELRVVLETSALGKAAFPAGPEYVVMIYNLYGSHSDEPGPKADESFILETAAKSVCLGPNVCFAFATGGFDWSSIGEITSLNEKDAIETVQATNSTPVRDKSSGALSFTYQNEASHTVWYADGETLCFWMDTAKTAGIKNFALWRLGGNSEKSLRVIADYLDSDAF